MDEKIQQVVSQCRAVAKLARIISDVYEDKAWYMCEKAGADIAGIVGTDSATLMETLCDVLNNMDAVTEEDVALFGPILVRAQKMFGIDA